MKTKLFFILPIAVSILLSCKSTKKAESGQSATTGSSEKVQTTAATSESSLKPSNGVYAPGQDEVNALLPYDDKINLDKLSKGYTLYSQSACIACHEAKNIYKIDSKRWKEILDDMADKAKISEEQKDAVYKYVVSVKAVSLKTNH